MLMQRLLPSEVVYTQQHNNEASNQLYSTTTEPEFQYWISLTLVSGAGDQCWNVAKPAAPIR